MGVAARSLGAHRSHLPLNNSKRQFFLFSFLLVRPSVRFDLLAQVMATLRRGR
jgi:hypothetical protein